MPRLGKEMKVTIPPPIIIDHPMNIIIDEIILSAPYFCFILLSIVPISDDITGVLSHQDVAVVVLDRHAQCC
jgi:hypothetical protein